MQVARPGEQGCACLFGHPLVGDDQRDRRTRCPAATRAASTAVEAEASAMTRYERPYRSDRAPLEPLARPLVIIDDDDDRTRIIGRTLHVTPPAGLLGLRAPTAAARSLSGQARFEVLPPSTYQGGSRAGHTSPSWSRLRASRSASIATQPPYLLLDLGLTSEIVVSVDSPPMSEEPDPPTDRREDWPRRTRGCVRREPDGPEERVHKNIDQEMDAEICSRLNPSLSSRAQLRRRVASS